MLHPLKGIMWLTRQLERLRFRGFHGTNHIEDTAANLSRDLTTVRERVDVLSRLVKNMKIEQKLEDPKNPFDNGT